MRKLGFLVLIATVLLLNACSSGNSDAPTDTNAHPQDWLAMHANSASASPNYNYSDCDSCHGADLRGSGDAVSCYSCHSYNTAPPFSIHPTTWVDPYVDHRAYAAINGFTSCNACHGPGLRGNQLAPSCYAGTYEGMTCHADGPGEVPHPLDGSYLEPDEHGPDAKADLTLCQSCHGEAGGPGDNPRFNVGIYEADPAGNGCESCHGTNYAHPRNWAGPNNTFHYSAANIQNACTLCHGENLQGLKEGGVGVSCQGCHASVTEFTLDCTFCHGYAPDGSPDLDVPIPVPHRTVAIIPSHGECTLCHGMSQTVPGGYFSATANYTLFNYAADTNGDHWNGSINMNSGFQYNPNNYGCDAAGCHFNDPEHRLSDSGLPVILKPYLGGN